MTRVIVINDDEEMKSKDDELVITYIVRDVLCPLKRDSFTVNTLPSGTR
jgi:hypothetical protein